MMGALFEGFETLVNRLIQKSEGFNMLTGAVSDVAITFFGKICDVASPAMHPHKDYVL